MFSAYEDRTMGASVIVRMINRNGQMTKYMVSTDGQIIAIECLWDEEFVAAWNGVQIERLYNSICIHRSIDQICFSRLIFGTRFTKCQYFLFCRAVFFRWTGGCIPFLQSMTPSTIQTQLVTWWRWTEQCTAWRTKERQRRTSYAINRKVLRTMIMTVLIPVIPWGDSPPHRIPNPPRKSPKTGKNKKNYIKFTPSPR